MAELRKDDTTFIDELDKIHDDGNGNITCCGGLLKMIMHIDGTDYYESQYRCECGNLISVRTMRDEEDMMIWGEV